jgi:hypothetical protein
VIPPKNSAAFAWRMEAVLDLYEEPYDPLFPVVCFDERPCQLFWPRSGSRCQSDRAAPSAATTSTRGEAWSTSRWPSSRLRAGAGPPRPSAGVAASSPKRCAVWSRRTTRKPSASGWSWTTPLHPLGGGLLRNLRSRGRSAPGAQGGVRVHAGSRLVAEHGRGRALGLGEAMLEAPDSGHRDPGPGSERLV